MNMKRWRWLIQIAPIAVGLAGCIGMDVGPINELTKEAGAPSPEFIPVPGDDASTVVGLAFSGGGTRAAAFAYGVLRELDDTVIDEEPHRRTLVDDIRMISGASGGAVAAAYFGYRGRDDYRDLRERFLVQDAEVLHEDLGFAGKPHPRLLWRRQRPFFICQMAGSETLRRRDIRQPEMGQRAHRLDKRLRHQQRHAVPVHLRYICGAVQQSGRRSAWRMRWPPLPRCRWCSRPWSCGRRHQTAAIPVPNGSSVRWPTRMHPSDFGPTPAR